MTSNGSFHRSGSIPLSAFVLILLAAPLFIQPLAGAQEAGVRDAPSNEHRAIDFFVMELPDSEGDGFEPHIVAGPGVSGGEWLYIDSPTGIGGGQSGNLWISKDHGDTWEAHDYGRNALGSGDSYTAIASDGTIYYTDLYLWSSTIDTSKDGGDTWIRNPLATVTRVGDRQWLAMGPTVGTFPGAQSETLYMIYNDIPQGLVIQRSQWSSRGLMWTMGNHRTPVTSSVGSRDHFAVDQNDGTIYLPNKDGGGIAIYVSTDGADSFSRYQVLTTDEDVQNIFIAADVDDEGNVYLAWSTQEHVFLGVSTDKARTWSITRVTDTDGTRVMPWVTVGDPGRVALTWYDTPETNGTSDEITDADWGAYAAITTDALSENVSFLITPILDYVHTGGIRTTGTGGNADRDLGDFFTCDVDEMGRLIVTFGNDGDDGPGARKSKVMFAKQLESPFMKEGVGPVAFFENETHGLTVRVDASGSYDMNGKGISAYLWDWGDGTNSTGIRSEHTFERGGAYDISLKVINMDDMRSTLTRNITVTAHEKAGGGAVLYIIVPLGMIMLGAALYIWYRKRKASGGIEEVRVKGT